MPVLSITTLLGLRYPLCVLFLTSFFCISPPSEFVTGLCQKRCILPSLRRSVNLQWEWYGRLISTNTSAWMTIDECAFTSAGSAMFVECPDWYASWIPPPSGYQIDGWLQYKLAWKPQVNHVCLTMCGTHCIEQCIPGRSTMPTAITVADGAMEFLSWGALPIVYAVCSGRSWPRAACETNFRFEKRSDVRYLDTVWDVDPTHLHRLNVDKVLNVRSLLPEGTSCVVNSTCWFHISMGNTSLAPLWNGIDDYKWVI